MERLSKFTILEGLLGQPGTGEPPPPPSENEVEKIKEGTDNGVRLGIARTSTGSTRDDQLQEPPRERPPSEPQEEHSDIEIEVITLEDDPTQPSEKLSKVNESIIMIDLTKEDHFRDQNRDSPDYEAYAEEEERKRKEDIKEKRLKALRFLRESIILHSQERGEKKLVSSEITLLQERKGGSSTQNEAEMSHGNAHQKRRGLRHYLRNCVLKWYKERRKIVSPEWTRNRGFLQKKWLFKGCSGRAGWTRKRPPSRNRIQTTRKKKITSRGEEIKRSSIGTQRGIRSELFRSISGPVK